MKASQLKKIALELSTKLPYQRTKDSPTIKYYTEWSRYEKHLGREASKEFVQPKKWVEEMLENPPVQTIVVKPREHTIYPGKGGAEIGIVNIDTSDDDDIIELIDPHEGKMLATHIALLEKAIIVRVPDEEKGFVRIVVLPPKEGHLPLHVKVILGRSSKLLMETIIAEEHEAGLVSLTMESILSEYSEMSNLAILDINSRSTLYGIRRSIVKGNSTNRMNTVITGGFMTHFKDESIQKERGAQAFLTSGILAYKNERVDYITNTINDAVDSTAIINVKGFNLGGFLVNRGTIKATENGYDSVNKLESILIPLTSEGYTVSVPMLEVDTDIVKEGAHSADISGFVEEQMFYLKSRGLSPEEAISLAIQSTILGVIQYAEDIDYEWAEKIALEIASEFLKKRRA